MATSSILKSSENNTSKHNQTVQSEIPLLSRAGRESMNDNDITKALKCFKRAYIISCKMTDKSIQKACLFNLGAAYICVGKPKKALKCLIKSRTNGLEDRDGDLYFNVAAAYDEMKEHGKAVKFYERAINEYGFNELHNIADALIKLGYCFVTIKDLPSAAHSFRLAGHSYLKIPRAEDAAMATREAANYMIKSQHFSKTEVLQTLDSCVQACNKVTDTKLLGTLYNNIGLHYAELKCFTEARKCFTESIKLCSGQQFAIRKMAVLLQNLGAVDNALYEYEKSLRCHAESADMYGTLGERNAQGQCLCNLAFAYSQLRKYEMAEFYYHQSLDAFMDTGDLMRQWQVSEGLGATYFCLGNHDQSIYYYKQALTLFVKSKETSDFPRERILQKLSDAIKYKLTKQHPVSAGARISRPEPDQSPSNGVNDAHKSVTSQYHESRYNDDSPLSDTFEKQEDSTSNCRDVSEYKWYNDNNQNMKRFHRNSQLIRFQDNPKVSDISEELEESTHEYGVD